MSEPAMFALVRNGEVRYFADRWASALLRREVLWGPEDFEKWVTQFQPLEEWEDDCDGGAVVDFDRRTLTWNGETSNYRVPRVWFVYRKLLAAAWPGFEIRHAAGQSEVLLKHLQATGHSNAPALAAPAGAVAQHALIVQNDDERDDESEFRPETVDEAKRYRRDADDGDAESDETFGGDSDDADASAVRAWVTIVDADGKTRQRELDKLPLDVLKAKPEALQALAALKPAAIPAEAIVSEGFCINPSQRTAGFWGSPELFAAVKKHGAQWKGWKVTWLERGYADQCALAGTRGMPMRTAEAVAKVVPLMLSTQQFDADVMLSAIGGGLKGFANKAVGCLLVVICMPLVIFGLVSGNWRAVLITIAATVLVVVGGYRLLLSRFKRMMKKTMSRGEQATAKPLVAGPQDEAARRRRIDELLKRAGLPRLTEVEPLFSNKTGLELLAES